MHLHALQRIFSNLTAHGYLLPEKLNEVDQLVSLAYEEYSFLFPCNSMTLFATPEEESNLPNRSELGRFASLERASGPEIVFAGSYELFDLIPQIQILFCRRRAEVNAGQATPSQQLRDYHDNLQKRIDTCKAVIDPNELSFPGAFDPLIAEGED